MKKIIFTLAFQFFLIFIFSSCDLNYPTSDINHNPNLITSISDRIYNPPDESILIKAQLEKERHIFDVAEDWISNDDKFNIFLDTPPSFMLYSISEILLPFGLNGNISDIYASANFLSIQTFKENSEYPCGELNKDNRYNYPCLCEGYSVAKLIYCDRTVTIKGHAEYKTDCESGTYFYELYLEQGWNRISYRTIFKEDNYSETEVFSGEDYYANWYYDVYSDEKK